MHEGKQTKGRGRSAGLAKGCVVVGALLIASPGVVRAEPATSGEPAQPEASGAAPAGAEAPAPSSPTPMPPPALAVAPSAPAAPAGAVPIPIGAAPKGPVAPAFPPAMPNIDFGGRLRVGLRFQGSDPKSFNDVAQSLYADLYASGQITPMWRWLVAVTTGDAGAAPAAPSNPGMQILDAIAGFTPLPEFQIYAGRLLVMADRFSPGGPWGVDEWFYPGFFVGTPPAVPKAGAAGRDYGIAAWGAPFSGHMKYYLGAYQMQDPTLSPLFSGRVQVSLLSTEPNWFHRTTYYGERDLISVGIGGQYQKNGSVMTVPAAMMGMTPPAAMLDNYREMNADLIVEKRIGDMGALSLEAAYYNFQGTYQPWKWSAVGAVAYTSPVLAGIGRLRPSFRFQQAQARQVTMTGAALDPTRVYDAQLTYSVMAWFAHVVVNYRRYDVAYASPSGAAPMSGAPITGNMIVLGLQLWDP